MAKKVPQWGVSAGSCLQGVAGPHNPLWSHPERVPKRSFTGVIHKEVPHLGHSTVKLPEEVLREALVACWLQEPRVLRKLHPTGPWWARHNWSLQCPLLTKPHASWQRRNICRAHLRNHRAGKEGWIWSWKAVELITGTGDNSQIFYGPWESCFLFVYLPPSH